MRRRVPPRTLLLALLAGAAPPGAPAGAETLAGRLRAMADEHGFALQGAGTLGDAPAPAARGDLPSVLRALLVDHDHVVEVEAGEVRRVIVIGRRRERPAALTVPARRAGGHHLVEALLEGLPGRRMRLELVVDTGASSLVLPRSLLEPLGYSRDALPERRGRTVNGIVTGRVARLERVSVGGASAEDVEALFIDDERLGGVSLLGMSFLERFSVTLGREDGRLVLEAR